MDDMTLHTTLGPLKIRFTDKAHAYVSTAPLMETLTVLRVDYHVSCHVYLWSDGKWHVGQEAGSDHLRRLCLHMTRANWMKRMNNSVRYSDSHPSDAAHKKAGEAITLAVNTFAAENADLVMVAEVMHLQEEMEKAQKEYADAVRLADELLQKRNAAQDAYKAAFEAACGAEVTLVAEEASNTAANS